MVSWRISRYLTDAALQVDQHGALGLVPLHLSHNLVPFVSRVLEAVCVRLSLRRGRSVTPPWDLANSAIDASQDGVGREEMLAYVQGKCLSREHTYGRGQKY